MRAGVARGWGKGREGRAAWVEGKPTPPGHWSRLEASVFPSSYNQGHVRSPSPLPTELELSGGGAVSNVRGDTLFAPDALSLGWESPVPGWEFRGEEGLEGTEQVGAQLTKWRPLGARTSFPAFQSFPPWAPTPAQPQAPVGKPGGGGESQDPAWLWL